MTPVSTDMTPVAKDAGPSGFSHRGSSSIEGSTTRGNAMKYGNFLLVLGALLLADTAYAANRPAGYVTICNENKTCSVAASTNVAFGRANQFFNKTLSGSFVCSSATFGGRVAGGVNECSVPSGSAAAAASATPAAAAWWWNRGPRLLPGLRNADQHAGGAAGGHSGGPRRHRVRWPEQGLQPVGRQSERRSAGRCST